MSRPLLYGALSICSFAMLLFVVGFVCWQFGLVLLTSLFYLVASKIMLLAFVLLVSLGLVALIGAIRRDLAAYFNKESIALRRLLSVRASQCEARRRLSGESRQLRYWSHFRRRRLLAADNKKRLRELFTAINLELQSMKNKLPADSYRAFSKALRQYHRHADAEAMLLLRKQLLCR